jgi:primase-polymerase (primpol)-like protein
MSAEEAQAYVRPPASAPLTPCNNIKTRIALAELVARRQWVAWRARRRLSSDGEKRTKVPINPSTGGTASVAEPATWTTFDQASGLVPGEASGVGYVLRQEDDLIGIDLNSARDQTGALVDWAAEIVACAETYAENSLRSPLPSSRLPRYTGRRL